MQAVRQLFYHVNGHHVNKAMGTAGATSLNRILQTTARLLFERGEDVAAVCNLLQGFVAPSQVRSWHERHCAVHGVTGAEISSSRAEKKMPMPPIDFAAIEIKSLEQLLESEPAESDEYAIEPDWPDW